MNQTFFMLIIVSKSQNALAQRCGLTLRKPLLPTAPRSESGIQTVQSLGTTLTFQDTMPESLVIMTSIQWSLLLAKIITITMDRMLSKLCCSLMRLEVDFVRYSV